MCCAAQSANHLPCTHTCSSSSSYCSSQTPFSYPNGPSCIHCCCHLSSHSPSMTNISVNFLHLFFLLLSLGAMDQANQGGGPLRGARAAPVLPSTVSASPSRRGSIVVDGGSAPEGATPERRGSLLAGPRVASVSQASARRLSSASISSDRRRSSISGTPGRRMSSVSITPESRMGSVSSPSGRRMISLSATPPDRRRSALAVPAGDLRRKSSYGLLSTLARDLDGDNDDDDDDDDDSALGDNDDNDDPDSSVVHFPVIKGRNVSGTQGVSLDLRELDSKSGAHPQMVSGKCNATKTRIHCTHRPSGSLFRLLASSTSPQYCECQACPDGGSRSIHQRGRRECTSAEKRVDTRRCPASLFTGATKGA